MPGITGMLQQVRKRNVIIEAETQLRPEWRVGGKAHMYRVIGLNDTILAPAYLYEIRGPFNPITLYTSETRRKGMDCESIGTELSLFLCSCCHQIWIHGYFA